MSNHFRGLLTNNYYLVDRDNMKLIPEVELIVHYSYPTYEALPDNTVKKEHKLQEFRMMTTPDGLDMLINSLQVVKQNMEVFGGLGAAMNAGISMVRADQAAKENQEETHNQEP